MNEVRSGRRIDDIVELREEDEEEEWAHDFLRRRPRAFLLVMFSARRRMCWGGEPGIFCFAGQCFHRFLPPFAALSPFAMCTWRMLKKGAVVRNHERQKGQISIVLNIIQPHMHISVDVFQLSSETSVQRTMKISICTKAMSRANCFSSMLWALLCCRPKRLWTLTWNINTKILHTLTSSSWNVNIFGCYFWSCIHRRKKILPFQERGPLNPNVAPQLRPFILEMFKIESQMHTH